MKQGVESEEVGMGKCWEDRLRAAVEIKTTQQVLAEPDTSSKQSINVAFFSALSLPCHPLERGTKSPDLVWCTRLVHGT